MLWQIQSIPTITIWQGETTGDDEMPVGVIALWSGPIASIPAGWQLCNGTNGTPDLRNLFVVGANADSAGVAKSTVEGGAPLQTGGGIAHNHSVLLGGAETGEFIQVEAFVTTPEFVPATTHTHETGGNTDNTTIVPPFFALAYIQRLS